MSYLYADDINSFIIPKINDREHLCFDIRSLLKEKNGINRIGFVFFMGIGDYFYTTRFLELLKTTHPAIHFDAFVSKNVDVNNSPLVADCLQQNPCIDNIFLYNGYKSTSNWENYNYIDAYHKKASDTFLLPIVYQHNPIVHSRFEELCKTFNVNPPSITLRPIIYNKIATIFVEDLFNKLKAYKKIIWLQTASRSLHFQYQETDALIKALLEKGFCIVTADKTGVKHDNLFILNTTQFTISDSIQLLKMLSENIDYICVCGLISCFLSISAGLNIPALIFFPEYDDMIQSVYFSNCYVITGKYYKQIPSDRQFIDTGCFIEKEHSRYMYSTKFVLDCFDTFFKQTAK